MNTVIPEFVKWVNFEKGPYYADVGNYGSAGSAHVEFFKALSQNFFQVEGGMYGYGRAVFGLSQKLGSGSLLYGGEAFLTDPVRGDQFEQRDRRWVAGLDARHTILSQWSGGKVENTFGLQVRNDWIHNGLYQSENRARVDKTDSETGTTLPATTREDLLTDTQVGFYWENKTQWAKKFRSDTALRGNLQYFDVTSLVTPANTGAASKVLPSPKLSLILGPWFNTEFYLQGGFSFHSNDGRGATQKVQPVSADNPYPNTPVAKIPALVPTKGAEIGVRTVALPHLQSTLSRWYLHSVSELQQNGDTGGTVASQQPSNRYGFEWANYYTPLENLAFDFDVADSRAFLSQWSEMMLPRTGRVASGFPRQLGL